MSQENGDTLVFRFERVLESVPARVFVSDQPDDVKTRMAVAYSGGLDSTVLLHLACAYARQKAIPLFAFHIHHGLNAKADEWLLHCRQTCQSLGIRFDAKKIALPLDSGESIEALARHERYAALTDLCRQYGVDLLLTAHHEDDQIETVLMQLFRGAGVAGLSGMDVIGPIPNAKKGMKPLLFRPLLTMPRRVLKEWANAQNLSWVEDDSNWDTRYARNAIRQEIMPVVVRFFSGAKKCITRSAQHMQSAGRLLTFLAKNDWEMCRDGDMLDLMQMKKLGDDRFDNLFRFWLDKCGLRMPSTSWIQQARDQLLNAKEDAQIKLELDGAIIRRYRQRIIFQEAEERPLLLAPTISFVWQGQDSLDLSSFGGKLFFRDAQEGIDVAWLQEQMLSVKPYYGKAMLKVNKDRPSKQVKAYYQEKGIPAWERASLPLLYAKEELLFAAGIGMAIGRVKKGEKCIRIEWQKTDQIKTSNH